MSERIHIVLDAEEKERYRALAEREGKNLSEWIREAVRERAAAYPEKGIFDSAESLREFFAEVDRRRGPNPGREPDWEEHKQAILDAKIEGLPKP